MPLQCASAQIPGACDNATLCKDAHRFCGRVDLPAFCCDDSRRRLVSDVEKLLQLPAGQYRLCLQEVPRDYDCDRQRDQQRSDSLHRSTGEPQKLKSPFILLADMPELFIDNMQTMVVSGLACLACSSSICMFKDEQIGSWLGLCCAAFDVMNAHAVMLCAGRSAFPVQERVQGDQPICEFVPPDALQRLHA